MVGGTGVLVAVGGDCSAEGPSPQARKAKRAKKMAKKKEESFHGWAPYWSNVIGRTSYRPPPTGSAWPREGGVFDSSLGWLWGLTWPAGLAGNALNDTATRGLQANGQGAAVLDPGSGPGSYLVHG